MAEPFPTIEKTGGIAPKKSGMEKNRRASCGLYARMMP